ncbi:MAG: 3-hydroxyacyl-CoA dehydrogenase family protein [Natrialbaceae archaeon]|nr:3-hydroxyacyl-CoA dehydrogenase family protein [Natrialbaceae archaeon]
MTTETVTVVGGGVMGSGIAQVLVLGGVDVRIRELETDLAEQARERVDSGPYGLESAVEGGHISPDDRTAALDRLSVTTDLGEALEGADAVIEAVDEDLTLKGRVFQELDAHTDTIPLFSNTSGFSVAAIAGAVTDPERVAVTHFFNPVPVMDLIEVVRSEATADRVVAAATDIADTAGKTTIVVEDDPTSYGFVANRCYGALRREAERIVDAGIATPEQVDTALEAGFNFPVGPFSLRGIGEEWD